METKTINQTVYFDASKEEVYQLLMDADKHSAFTGSKVIMSKEINGKFSVFDGYCHGYNMELDEGRKIVQAWNFAEDGWAEDHYSICTFLLENENGKTKLTFTQTDVPEHKKEALESGWKEYYWEPMKEYLESIK